MADTFSPNLHPTTIGGRYKVEIAAYVRLSFNEEVELNGWVGEDTMVGESRKSFRSISVISDVSGEQCKLSYGLRRLRALPVSGRVMGQPVSGSCTVADGAVTFEGRAGQEPLRYAIDKGGGCTSFHRDLGIRVDYQSFYSVILGSVERIPDAVMIGLLLPVVVRHRHLAL